MITDDTFRDAFYNLGSLKSFYIKEEFDFITSIELIFGNGIFSIDINSEDDEIIYKIKPVSETKVHRSRRSPVNDLFRKLKSCNLRWAWELTNQQGYTDCLQLEFWKDGCDDVILQFMAIASSIRVYILRDIDEEVI